MNADKWIKLCAEKQRVDVDHESDERYPTNTVPKVIASADSIGMINKF